MSCLPPPAWSGPGWSRRAPLETVVLHERWDRRPPTAGQPRTLRAPDQAAVVGARDQADTLLTPPGSLGVLDRALDRLVALGIDDVERASLVLVAADHPVTRHAVSTYPSTVTREVLEATVMGESLGAAAARATGFGVIAGGRRRRGRAGGRRARLPAGRPRGDLVEEDAVTAADVDRLFQLGRGLGRTAQAQVLALGEAGVGNTTVAAALCSALLGLGAQETVGLGAGGDSATVERKRAVVSAALSSRSATGWGRAVTPSHFWRRSAGPSSWLWPDSSSGPSKAARR